MFIWNGFGQGRNWLEMENKAAGKRRTRLCLTHCLCWFQLRSWSISHFWHHPDSGTETDPNSSRLVLLTPRKVPLDLWISSRTVSARDKSRISPGRASVGKCWTGICVLGSHSSSLIKVFRARTAPGGNHLCLLCQRPVDFNSLLIWMFLKFLLKWGQEVMQKLMSRAGFVGRVKVFLLEVLLESEKMGNL